MQSNFRQYMLKHNGLTALFLSLVILISSSLQLVHGEILDHNHDSDCAIYAVYGNAPEADSSSVCVNIKQQAEIKPYAAIVSLVVIQFKQHAPRAPPALI
jgi:hypothetical protein